MSKGESKLGKDHHGGKDAYLVIGYQPSEDFSQAEVTFSTFVSAWIPSHQKSGTEAGLKDWATKIKQGLKSTFMSTTLDGLSEHSKTMAWAHHLKHVVDSSVVPINASAWITDVPASASGKLEQDVWTKVGETPKITIRRAETTVTGSSAPVESSGANPFEDSDNEYSGQDGEAIRLRRIA